MTTTRYYVIDVSAYQPQARSLQWWLDLYNGSQVRGAIVKTSEGTYYQNPYGWAQVQAAKAGKQAVSGYHFARFISDSNQAYNEANYAVATANSMGINQGAPLVLDYELRAGWSGGNTQACITFLNRVKELGFKPVFYSYSGMSTLWDFEAIHQATGATMWIAAYPHMGASYSPDYNYFPGISNFIDAWQFTDDFNGLSVDGSIDFNGVFTGGSEKVTSGGNLDSLIFNPDKPEFTVSGWYGSDKAKGKNYTYVILTNKDEQHEFARVKVDVSDRPDVAKAMPDIPNGGKSGFEATFAYTPEMVNQTCQVIFRYTDDPAGNGNATDYVHAINFNQNTAYQDKIGEVMLYKNQFIFSGWFASDQSLGLKYRYLILYDATHKKELQRLRIQPVERDDVYNVHKDIYGSKLAGFSGTFDYSANMVGQQIQIVARYSDDPKVGEGNRVDYWFNPFTGPAMPTLDGKTTNEIIVNSFQVDSTKDGKYHLTYK